MRLLFSIKELLLGKLKESMNEISIEMFAVLMERKSLQALPSWREKQTQNRTHLRQVFFLFLPIYFLAVPSAPNFADSNPADFSTKNKAKNRLQLDLRKNHPPWMMEVFPVESTCKLSPCGKNHPNKF